MRKKQWQRILKDEVCWYRLSQIQGRLGNVPEQQKASAEFQRLHDLSTRQKGFGPSAAPSEVTQQEVDPNSHSNVPQTVLLCKILRLWERWYSAG